MQLLLDAIVDYLPCPTDRQDQIGLDPKDNEKTLIRKPSSQEPFSGLAFKVVNDKFLSTITYVRIYSGILRTGEMIRNATKGKDERVGRMLLMHSDKRGYSRSKSWSGCYIMCFKDTVTGDTYVRKTTQFCLKDRMPRSCD